MMGDAKNLEEQCEDAVFDICDTRERYPSLCVEELDKYLRLKNDIAMAPIILKQIPQNFEISLQVDTRKIKTSENSDSVGHICRERIQHLQNMTDKVQELKLALKQLEENKNFELKHHLK